MSEFNIIEYVWLDGDKNLRSKSRTLYLNEEEIGLKMIPHWTYNGFATNQTSARESEIILKPCALFRDPFRQGTNLIVFCETYNQKGEPSKSNKRFYANRILKTIKEHQCLFGLEQEYILYDWKSAQPLGSRPLGWEKYKDPAANHKYYAGVGADRVFGRDIAEKHYQACLYAGIKISGINAECAPAQWEYQIGPGRGIQMSDDLWVSRYLLERICEQEAVLISFQPKPELNIDWINSGLHLNFSTQQMRDKNGYLVIEKAIEKLRNKHQDHIMVYGENTNRLTGKYDTSKKDQFTSGVGDRSASIRIPFLVHQNQAGYLEDRRPAANCDPYVIITKMVETILL